MAGRLFLPVLIAFALAGTTTAQTPPDTVESRIAEQQRAVTLYLSGDADGAVRLLGERRLDEQRELVDRILRLARTRLHELTDATEPWTHEAVAALATLHMESALQAYSARDPMSRIRAREHVALAEPLFAFAASWPLRKSADRRWELVLGLTALADGEIAWAASFLEPACRKFPDDVPLLVACGTVYETRAAMTATTPFVRITDDLLRKLRQMRATWLDQAEKELARALRAEPANLEARLRLAHVRAMKGEGRDAAGLLADVESGKVAADVRTQYLALLFLGQIAQRARQDERAAALFRRAAALGPGVPTALLGLAYAEHARGDRSQAAELVKRAVSISEPIADPWWGYRFGQYWLRDPLLASLRAEVRK
jgi:tetratricopeptide (TPR) repeat protein